MLPDECLVTIFTFCSAKELTHIIPYVSTTFYGISSNSCYDEMIWKPKCEGIWKHKVKASWEPFLHNPSLSFQEKYYFSRKDANRYHITAEELCRFTWAFRFKESVGNHWTNLYDPYWNNIVSSNKPPQKKKKRNIKRAHSHNDYDDIEMNKTDRNIDNRKNSSDDDDVDDESESEEEDENERMNDNKDHDHDTRIPYLKRCFRMDGTMHNPRSVMDDLERMTLMHNLDLKWRLNNIRKYDDGTIRQGRYLQINEWPSSGVERTDDWGWVIHNQFTAYVYPPKNLLFLHEELENDIERWF